MKKLHFNRKKLLQAVYVASMATALSFGTSAQAQTVVPTGITAPYSADLTNGGSFATTDVGGVRNPGDGGSWTPTAAGFQGTVTSGGFYSTETAGSTTVSNLGASSANNFVVTTDISATSFSGYQDGTVGIFALGNGASASGYDGSRVGYIASMVVGGSKIGAPAGSITIGSVNSAYPSFTGLAAGATPLTFTAGDIYQLVLQGTYNASNQLTMSLTVTDLNNLSNTESISTGLISSPYAGQNFGSEISSVFGTYNATVSNFSVNLASVPEPSDYALMILGGVALLGVARRQRNATA